MREPSPCRFCKRPLDAGSATNLCLACQAHWRAEAAIPGSVQCFGSLDTGAIHGKKWRDYRVLVVGLRVPRPPEPEAVPWPIGWVIDTPDRVLQIWLRRIHYRDPDTDTFSAAYVENRWDPERGQRVSLHGLEDVASADEAARVCRGGLTLLRFLDTRGRPSGITTYTHDELLARIGELRAATPGRLSREQWADRLGIDRRTFFRYLHKWSDLRDSLA